MTGRMLLIALLAACSESDDDPPGGGGDGGVWSGTSEVTLEYTGNVPGFSHKTVTSATVTWTFDETMGYFSPSGSVTYTETGMYDHSPDPPCVVTASYSGPINTMTSSLVIQDGMYFGGGLEIGVTVVVNDSCDGPKPTPTSLAWLGPSAMGQYEGDTINGMTTGPAGADTTQTTRFTFTKQ